MLKQYCTTGENHLKFCSKTLTQEAKRLTMLDDRFIWSQQF